MAIFDHLLRLHEQDRHRGVLSSLPVSFRRRDYDGDGFVTLDRAAAEMKLRESEILALARRGALEHRREGDTLLVRPAIVSVLGIRRGCG